MSGRGVLRYDFDAPGPDMSLGDRFDVEVLSGPRQGRECVAELVSRRTAATGAVRLTFRRLSDWRPVRIATEGTD
jgi:hypothetical protein